MSGKSGSDSSSSGQTSLSGWAHHSTTAVVWCSGPHPLYNRLVIPQASQLLLQHSEGNNDYLIQKQKLKQMQYLLFLFRVILSVEFGILCQWLDMVLRWYRDSIINITIHIIYTMQPIQSLNDMENYCNFPHDICKVKPNPGKFYRDKIPISAVSLSLLHIYQIAQFSLKPTHIFLVIRLEILLIIVVRFRQSWAGIVSSWTPPPHSAHYVT